MRQSFTSWAWSRSEDSVLLNIDDCLFWVLLITMDVKQSEWPNNRWQCWSECVCTFMSLGLLTKNEGLARCTFLCSSFSKLPTFYFCSDLHWTLVHLLKVVEKTQKICSVSRILVFWTWNTFSNFAQWRYTNQWPFREVVLLLVENWIPIPRLRDVKYHLSCQFLMVLLQTNSSCTDIHCKSVGVNE